MVAIIVTITGSAALSAQHQMTAALMCSYQLPNVDIIADLSPSLQLSVFRNPKACSNACGLNKVLFEGKQHHLL